MSPTCAADQNDAVRSSDAHAHDCPGQGRDRQSGAGHEQHPDDAGERPRQRRDDDEGIEPRLEIDDDHQIDENDGAGEAQEQLVVRAGHRMNLSAQSDVRAARHVLAGLLQDALDVGRDRAEIAVLHGAVDVDDRLDVVMRDDAGARPLGDPGEAAQILRRGGLGRCDRHVGEIRRAVDAVLWHLRDDRIGDAVLGVQPEIRLNLATAGQRDEKAVGGVTLGQSDLAGERPVDLHVELRIVEDLLDAQVGDAGHRADAL
jgi:hypothetical protein